MTGNRSAKDKGGSFRVVVVVSTYDDVFGLSADLSMLGRSQDPLPAGFSSVTPAICTGHRLTRCGDPRIRVEHGPDTVQGLSDAADPCTPGLVWDSECRLVAVAR